MPTVTSLAALARLAQASPLPDRAPEDALALVRGALGASQACLVYGAENEFQYYTDGEPLELSRTALWILNRDLTTASGPRAFTARFGRVVNFHDVRASAPCDYVASLVPVARGTANMLVVRGPFAGGLTRAQLAFVTAALPSIGALLARRLEVDGAEREHKQLSTLVSVGRVISESEEMEAMLTSICKMTSALTGLDYVSIDYVGRSGKIEHRCVNYEIPTSIDTAGDRWRASVTRQDPVRNMVMATRQPMLFEDAQTDERIPESGRNFFTRTLIRSAAVLPLPAKDEVVGVLQVASLRPLAFSAQERDLLEGIAGQIATAIKGIQLYEDRRIAEEELRHAQDLLTATIESTADGILVVNSEGGVAYSNARFAEIWRIPHDVIESRDDERLLSNVVAQLDDPEAFLERVRYLYGTMDESFDTLRFKDGRVIERYSRPLITGGKASGRVWSFRDATERTRAEESLRRQARHDSLTRLLNHAAITEMLRERAEACASLAVVVADVDGMKAVNDTYGHLVGDEVLVSVANALTREDAIVGRYGGDEFLVIVPDGTREEAERYCREVLDTLAGAHVTDPQTRARVPVVASLGVAVYPHEAESVEDAIRLADNAMYSEKRERTSPAGAARSALGDDRAAKMIGEIVPMLTSPGKVDEKLRMVAYRLSLGAGYDVVRFNLASRSIAPMASTFAKLPRPMVDQWEQAGSLVDNSAITARLRETKRPIIIDDLQSQTRYTEAQREVLRASNVNTALIVPMLWQDEFVGVLSVAVKGTGGLDARDARFLTAVSDQVTALIRMETLLGDLESATQHLLDARGDTVIMLAAAAEAHDQTTGRHLHRVRLLTEMLAAELGYSVDEVEALGLAAVLHDIGKIRVPESILLSPARLNGEDWALMKHHTVWGAEFLSERPGFELAAKIARAHHERYDGSGYPRGLAGEEIPEAAAIVSVADSLDAITNDRPYRAGRSIEWAVSEIERCSGTQFNPRVVAALARLYARDRELSVAFRPDAEERAA